LARIVNARLIAQLLQQHGEALQRYAAQWTVTPEDCVQEAIVKLAGLDALPESPAAWLYRVVRNDALNRGRGERRRAAHEQHDRFGLRRSFQGCVLDEAVRLGGRSR